MLGCATLLLQNLCGQPLKVLAIGDSLTEEYRFEGVFSGPVISGVPVPVANTKNWVEILSDRRSSEISFGGFDPNLAAYTDFRDGGYAYNYGVPSFTTVDWVNVINWSSLPNSNWSYKLLAMRTHDKVIDNLKTEGIGAVVIFLGGNDLKSDYAGIFRNDVPPALLQDSVTNLGQIITFVRQQNATVPIIVCTFPDVGATPEVAGKYSDPVNRARARQRIADTNAAVMALATSRGASVARIDHVIDRVFDDVPFYLNGTLFKYPPDDANPPDHLFCHDGFHPSTVGQALIGNEIIAAINQATGRLIPRMSNREIIGDVVGLNPEQPYLDWAVTAGGMLEDPDGDGSPNLIEYLLGGNPMSTDQLISISSNGVLSFRPLPGPARFANLGILESTTLANDWKPVPASRITVLPDGTWAVAPNGSDRNFYRLTGTPKP